MELSQTWHKRGDFPIDSAERHSIQQTVTNGRIVHEEDIFLAQKGVGIMRDDITISSALEESERCTSEIERQVLSDASHCTDLVRLAVGKLLRLHITISLRLKEWKMAQNKMIYDYSVIQAELSVIEVYISSLMGIALRLAQVCHHLGEAALLDSTKELIESVVSTSMVLEQQPPRVLKTNSRLAPKLRYLLSQHATKITPARAIVLTADGVSLLKAGKRVQDCALLEKDVITMSFDGKSWTGDGQGMKLKKFRRVKGGLKVTEQLYYLAFVCGATLQRCFLYIINV